MNTILKTNRYRLFIIGYVGLLVLMLACLKLGGSAEVQQGAFKIEKDVVSVLDENNDWVPVASDALFDFTGALESTDPWMAAGITLETNDATRIEDGLQVGDLVRAHGIILADETWLAQSITRVETENESSLVLIGRVDSVEPWSVKGMEFDVTDATVIEGELTPGMLVRVELIRTPEDTWEAVSITALADATELPDCTTIIATVVSIDGNEIQFAGWPVTVTLGAEVKIENGDSNEDGAGAMNADQVVIAIVCQSEDGKLIIVQIIIVGSQGEGAPAGETEKVQVCHKPSKNAHTLSIPASALPAHLGHGDTLGACP